jgi:hypothetical protein
MPFMGSLQKLILPEAGDASLVTPAMLPLTQAPDFHTCLLPTLPFLRSAHHANIMMINFQIFPTP